LRKKPFGGSAPGDSDRKTHERLAEAAKIPGLRVLDHIIIARKGFFSFRDKEPIGF
jgi:DNA repair protein RadC